MTEKAKKQPAAKARATELDDAKLDRVAGGTIPNKDKGVIGNIRG